MRLVFLLTARSVYGFVCPATTGSSITATAVSSFTATRVVDEAAAFQFAEEAAGAETIDLPQELAHVFGAVAGERAPIRRATGPVESHRDRIFATAEHAGTVSLAYLNVTGPPADFVLTDATTGETKTLKIVPGLAITYDNAKFLHRVDAPEASTRMMIGPTSRTMPGEVFKPVGIVAAFWSPEATTPECKKGADAKMACVSIAKGACSQKGQAECEQGAVATMACIDADGACSPTGQGPSTHGTGQIQQAGMMAVEHPEPPAVVSVRVATLVAVVFMSGFALGGLLMCLCTSSKKDDEAMTPLLAKV